MGETPALGRLLVCKVTIRSNTDTLRRGNSGRMTSVSLSQKNQVGAVVEQWLCSEENNKMQRWERLVPNKKVREISGLGGYLYKAVGTELCLDTGDTAARGLSARRCTQGASEQRLRMTYHAPST